MKKNNLFKAVGIVILAYILMSWIVPIIYSITGTEAQVSYQIGFVSILSVLLETFSGFGTVVVYVLLVGAFYGVLKVTGAYDKVLELLSSKASGKEKGVLISTIVGMAIISSVSGLDLGLLVVFPILISLLVLSNSTFILSWIKSLLVTTCSIEASALSIKIWAVTWYFGCFIIKVYSIPNTIDRIIIVISIFFLW